MSRRYSLPFKTLVGPEVQLGAWHYRKSDGDWLHVGEGIPGWDYLTRLEFQREVAVQNAQIRQACDLDPEAPLVLTVTVHSPVARFRSVLAQYRLNGATSSIRVGFEVPSSEVADHLRLETEIILIGGIPTRARFAAHLAGSRLHGETVRVEIEGTTSRMPMEIANFARQLPWLGAPHAPWHIDCGSGDLHFPVMRNLRVYLNDAAPAFLDGLMRGDVTLQALLKADVAGRLLESAFEDPDFLDGVTDFGEGTMGEVAVRALKLCFGAMKPKDVQALAERSPAKFGAMIRSRFSVDHD